jgi:tRNA-Thr(GGU) m(6)t(6)A37 methyltransferase TsaA
MQAITMNPVAVVHTEAKDDNDTEWGKVISEIHVDKAFEAGLQGLDAWSHIVVIFSMHENPFNTEEHLVNRPRNRDDMPEVGTFAQRSRFTPNTIGITAVQLLGVKDNVIRVKGLDAIDGTPVLDIKPYAPYYDGVREALVPAWFIRLMQR